MRENRTSGSMRRGERRVMVHSADGHRPERAETVGRRRTCTRPRSPFTLLNAMVTLGIPPHPALSPEGGEGNLVRRFLTQDTDGMEKDTARGSTGLS